MPAVLSDKNQNYERRMFIFAQQKYLLNLLLKVYQTSFPVYIPKVTEKHKNPMATVIMKKKKLCFHKNDSNSEVLIFLFTSQSNLRRLYKRITVLTPQLSMGYDIC